MLPPAIKIFQFKDAKTKKRSYENNCIVHKDKIPGIFEDMTTDHEQEVNLQGNETVQLQNH
jgi:hypothetical protein